MKFFIINVNSCLSPSQYGPFFYEHIHQGKLAMLDEIEDTCQLTESYKQIQEYINRKPGQMTQGVILLLIPRDFANPLRPQDYELYNDINTYLHLVRNLKHTFCVHTFYVDRTGVLEQNDAVYQQLKTVNHSLQSNRPELDSHFLRLPEQIPAEGGDYKAFLREQIASLCDCTGSFYSHMLEQTPDITGDATMFRNALHHYIGEARDVLSQINHIHVPIYRNDLADEIRIKLKLVYYIKTMISGRVAPEQLPAFQNYPFDDEPHAKRLIVTYCKRLSTWYHEHLPISKEGTCDHWTFRLSISAAAEYRTQVDDLINKRLSSVSVNNISNKDMVDEVFTQLGSIVSGARDSLRDLAAQEAKSLLDRHSYEPQDPVTFALDEVSTDEQRQEAETINAMNQHSPLAPPDFAAENRLEQELEQINFHISQILENLSAYKIGFFLAALVFSLLGIAGLYIGAQYSVFVKEHTLWIYLLYLLISGGAFSIAWFTVHRHYLREIAGQLTLCKNKVGEFLRAFQVMAEEFEHNVLAAGKYNCLKKQLDQKRAAREQYQQSLRKYAWHKMKVDQILKNFRFFDAYVANAHPYEEAHVTLESYDQDPEHTEFYLMKVFQG